MYSYIFDIGGVLVGYNADDLAVMLAGAGDYDLNKVRTLLGYDLLYQIETGRMTSAEFYEKYVCSAMPGLSFEGWSNIYTEYFELNLTGFELMLELKSSGRKVYILSNLAELHRKAIERKVPGFFGHCVKNFLSYEMGCHKPEPEIYQKLIDEIGEKPGNLVFLDDSPQNIEGAKAAGINGILFSNERIIEIREQIRRLESL